MFSDFSSRNKKFIIPLVIIIMGIIMIGVISSNKVEERITIEAGSDSLNVADFLIDKEDIGEFVTDLSIVQR